MMQLCYYSVFVSLIILSEQSQCPVGIICIPGLFIRAFPKEVYQLFIYSFFLLNHAASQSTLKFSGLKQPLFIISHESKGHLCYLASLSQAQTISAGPIVLSGLVGGSAGSW